MSRARRGEAAGTGDKFSYVDIGGTTKRSASQSFSEYPATTLAATFEKLRTKDLRDQAQPDGHAVAENAEYRRKTTAELLVSWWS